MTRRQLLALGGLGAVAPKVLVTTPLLAAPRLSTYSIYLSTLKLKSLSFSDAAFDFSAGEVVIHASAVVELHVTKDYL